MEVAGSDERTRLQYPIHYYPQERFLLNEVVNRTEPSFPFSKGSLDHREMFYEFVLFSDLLVSVAADVATVEATLETASRKFRSVELKIRDGRNKLAHKKIIREKTHYLNVQVSPSLSCFFCR
jgi:hypothetical protein